MAIRKYNARRDLKIAEIFITRNKRSNNREYKIKPLIYFPVKRRTLGSVLSSCLVIKDQILLNLVNITDR